MIELRVLGSVVGTYRDWSPFDADAEPMLALYGFAPSEIGKKLGLPPQADYILEVNFCSGAWEAMTYDSGTGEEKSIATGLFELKVPT